MTNATSTWLQHRTGSYRLLVLRAFCSLLPLAAAEQSTGVHQSGSRLRLRGRSRRKARHTPPDRKGRCGGRSQGSSNQPIPVRGPHRAPQQCVFLFFCFSCSFPLQQILLNVDLKTHVFNTWTPSSTRVTVSNHSSTRERPLD